jgi:hypothetical protein
VVRASLTAAIALRWIWEAVSVPELLVIAGTPCRLVEDYAEMEASIRLLITSSPSHGPPPDEIMSFFLAVLRRRLTSADSGSSNQASLLLARRLTRRARAVSKNRDGESLELLDAVLDRLRGGVNIGSERSLDQLLRLGVPHDGLREWVARQRHSSGRPPEFEIDAAIFGDGTIP